MDHAALVRKHLSDYSASRWGDFRADLAADVFYEEVATGTTARGVDDYLSVIQRWKRAFPDLQAHVLGAVSAGDQVVAEIEWQGTHTGPFDGPFGLMAPTGRRGSARAALVYRIDGGKIAETRHYFDVLTVLTQLGVVPDQTAASAARSWAQRSSSAPV